MQHPLQERFPQELCAFLLHPDVLEHLLTAFNVCEGIGRFDGCCVFVIVGSGERELAAAAPKSKGNVWCHPPSSIHAKHCLKVSTKC